MVDFELRHSTRHCAVNGRELRPGEVYYTVLRKAGAEVERADYSSEAWTGPPEVCLAWWKPQVPLATEAKKQHWAPNDVMLQLFETLAEQPEQADMRYVLTLLLIRRRLLRLEESQRDEAGIEQLTVYCPKNETEYHLPAIVPDDARVQAIQAELGKLLS